jgi:hypothetical protein
MAVISVCYKHGDRLDEHYYLATQCPTRRSRLGSPRT